MEQTIASFAVVLVLGVLVTSCSDDSAGDANSGAAGSGASGMGGTPGAGGSDTGGSGTGGSATGGGATGGAAGTGGAGGTGGGAGGGVPTSDADCALLTQPQCRQCCGDLHTAGGMAYDDAFTACVCTADTCEASCQQSVCATPPNGGPTPSCNTCLDDVTEAGSACDAPTVEAACTDADCAAYLSCTDGCAG